MRKSWGGGRQSNVHLENRLVGSLEITEDVNSRAPRWDSSEESSTEADIIERLMILAASIAVKSSESALRRGFISLLYSLAEAFEEGEIASFVVPRHPPYSAAKGKKQGKATAVLTARQREVLRLRSAGLGVARIAERLNLAPSTIHTHIRDAIERLGVSGGVMAAVAAARLLGLI
jgi:DNA-binding NarL/FixJ family response regulator